MNRSTLHLKQLRFAPLKQNVARINKQPSMTKTLRKTIMKRSKLKNKLNKESAKNWSDYKQRLSHCSNLLKKFKTRHFNHPNVKDTNKNKRFWKIRKPFSQLKIVITIF